MTTATCESIDTSVKSRSGSQNDAYWEQDRGHIEVAVRSLDGICVDDNGNDRPSYPWVTATVTFSGSASNMKVGSCSLCGITGQLLVESEPVSFGAPHLLSRSPRLAAHWMEETRSNGTPMPHLTMYFPTNHKQGPIQSLQRGNRGATFINQELELSQTDITVSNTTTSSCRNAIIPSPGNDEDCRSRSAIWSDSGASMPEIIEMYVRLRHVDDDDRNSEALWDGVAFLVVYGHERDEGTHTLELPIQKVSYDRHKLPPHSMHKAGSQPSGRESTRMRLSPDARLTVQVKVVSCRPTPTHPVASSIVAAGDPQSVHVASSQSVMEAELGPVLDKLRRHELLAQKLCQNQKRAMMNVDVPTYPVDSALPNPPPPSFRQDGFCRVPVLDQWATFFSRMASMAMHCDTSMVAQKRKMDWFYGEDDSTIITRDSLEI